MAELRVTTDDNATLWVDVAGHGPPLVLCHGGPGLWDYFEDFVGALGDVVTVVRWDQRGCGRSEGGEEPPSVARSVEDLETVRAALTLERWTVAGHSWGATLALCYGLAHPRRTAALLYLSGVGLGQAWHSAFRAERARRLGPDRERWQQLATSTRTPEEESEYRRLSWSVDAADRERAVVLAASLDRPFPVNTEANRRITDEMATWDEADLGARGSELSVPTLIVHGTGDPRPMWALDSLVDALPDAELLALDGVGHVPWLEDAPGFFDPVRRFLGRVGPA
ncbi:MAG TPA: alpha/beta fold hydrolase [Acidimicrobiales bacterium]|nr:alpha/beta fold hydrolase [Acidimicrobiales bacterium]